MARLYANENFPLAVVKALRMCGHDAVTVQETGRGNIGLPDEQILQEATADRRAVLTMNRRHFVRLHRAWSGHAGIIACTYDPDSEGLSRRINAAIADRDSLAGELIRVNRPPR